MFICEIWLFDWYFPQFCTSDMSKYGYLEVFQRFPAFRNHQGSTFTEKDRNKLNYRIGPGRTFTKKDRKDRNKLNNRIGPKQS